ncbi:Spo12 domain-containing protein [Phanerochaete sordida]|uniref:Spo12 domain-containing protein n=1 Tax=Phanerochaete sordida TaxID=48140 RepID=A0A9P3FYR1_9APHY|nr:Spo12 domain-containing protein [Phanerochaete sordida]
MSALPTPDASPVPVQPLHNPSQAAKVVVPQAPVGTATTGTAALAPGMGAKALLAKRMAKNINPAFVSPTDNLMTPCSKKLNAAKKKTFAKGVAKPMPSLFSQPESKESDSSGDEAKKMDDDENPF